MCKTPIELFTRNSLNSVFCFKMSSEFLKIDSVEWKNNAGYYFIRHISLYIYIVIFRYIYRQSK